MNGFYIISNPSLTLNFLIIALTLHFKLPNLVFTFQGLMHSSLEFSRHVNFEPSKKKSFHLCTVTYA